MFEHINNGNTVPYDPAEGIYTDYKLTEEEHKRFDNIEGKSLEEIETAKKCFVKLKGPVLKTGIDQITEEIEKLWFEKKYQRELQLQMNQTQLEMFDKAVKKEFSNSDIKKGL